MIQKDMILKTRCALFDNGFLTFKVVKKCD